MTQTETKTCQSCKADFVIEPDDFGFYEKMKVPPPTWCPDCRMKRRCLWRNPNTMYRRKCDATGKMIFGMFHPDADVVMYDRDYWWTDKWDPQKYGRDYDFSRPFFDQINDLIKEVPWPSRSAINLVNSDYCMNCDDLKNCYLVFNAKGNENCYYCVGLNSSKDSMDITEAIKIEKCYDSFYIAMGYNLSYCQDCEDCRDLILCKNMTNCSNCVGSINLRNQKYNIFNVQYTKEEYEQKVKEMRLDTYSGLLEAKRKFNELEFQVPVKYAHILKSVNSTGEYIWKDKNVKDSFLIDGSEDLRFCQGIIHPPHAKNCYDYSFFGVGAENFYECVACGIHSSDLKFCALTYTGAQNAEYTIMSPGAQNSFGCVGFQKANYCILNKQYTKEEYDELVDKIKQHMSDMPYIDSKGREYKYGEFFPLELSPYGYNDTVSQEFFRLTPQEVQSEGLKWSSPTQRETKSTMSWKEIPDSINDADESIADELITCKAWEKDQEEAVSHNCTEVFRILKQELQFCKSGNVPLPRKCFNSRHYDRLQLRNMPKLYNDGKCQCAGAKSDNEKYVNAATAHQSHSLKEHCPNTFQTPYGPERKEIVYCEQCYQAEVI